MLIRPLSSVENSFALQDHLREIRDFLTTTKLATLDFPNIPINTNADLTVTIKGVKSGDTVTATPPSTIEAGLTWCAFVSANDTITVRLHCHTTAAIDPASAIWRITVFKY